VNSSRRRARVRVATAVAGLSLVLAGCSFTSPPDVLKVTDPGDGRSGQIGNPGGTDGAVKLRNFLVVSDGSGKPGTLVGAVANETPNPVTVTLTVVQTEQGGQQSPIGTTTVQLKPSEYVQFGNPAGGTGGTATPTGAAVSPSPSSSPAQSIGSDTTYTPTPPPSSSTGSVGPTAPAAGRVTTYRISSVPQPSGALLQLFARTADGGGTTIDVPIIPPVGEYAYLAPGASASPTATSTPSPTGSLSPSVDTSGAATQSTPPVPSGTAP
jgi:hypothetical protein